MKKNQKRSALLLLSFSLLLYSCVKKDISTTKTDHDTQVLSYIKSLGYSDKVIVDAGNRYVVEGDISFPKNMILPVSNTGPAREEQYYNGTLVNLAHQIIGVRIDPSLAAQTAEVNAAVALWNNAHSWVTFQVVTGGEQVLIRNTNLGTGVCGQGQFPVGGVAGSTIDINVNEVAADNFNERMINIAHEMGHTIGFRHTNGDNGVFGTPVPGWGGTDASSIMNGGMCHSLPTSLSYMDLNAVNALYPNPYPPSISIDLSYSLFTIRWGYVTPNPSDNLTGYELDYGGQNGVGFSGSIVLSPGTNSYTIPGVSSAPAGSMSGYVAATIKAVYSSATYQGPSASKSLSNGVWH